MHRYGFEEPRVRPEAFLAFLAGVFVAYFIQGVLAFGGGQIFLTLIVAAVGGLWYHLRGIA